MATRRDSVWHCQLKVVLGFHSESKLRQGNNWIHREGIFSIKFGRMKIVSVMNEIDFRSENIDLFSCSTVQSGSEDSICEIELVVGKSALGQPWTQRVPPFICTTSIQQLLLSKALIWYPLSSGPKTLLKTFFHFAYCVFHHVYINHGFIFGRSSENSLDVLTILVYNIPLDWISLLNNGS